MAERPTLLELVVAVREFLERDVGTVVDGRVSFHARVAANALGIVERELELGPANDAAERARLASLLGHHGDLDELRTELAAAIREGTFDDRRAELIAALRATTSEALAVANPRYRE
jgi:hypothetical protein